MLPHRNAFALRKPRNRLLLLFVFCHEPLSERLDGGRARLFRSKTTGFDLRLTEIDRPDDKLGFLDRKSLTLRGSQ
jgi:hypothetical protein